MKEYAIALSYAIPGFLVLMAIEFGVSIYRKKQVYNAYDTITSLSSGITNVVKDILGLIITVISYEWLYNNLALLQISSNWVLFLIAFIALDFSGYWIHRFEHTVNIFWNRHIIHHSSEEYNLACALRQNLSAFFALFTFLLLPAAILGVPPEIIRLIAPIHLFAQFWYHTRLIDKMGFLEHIIVTPSHHRVHHAINDIYLDKNYGQIFILWDKWFGTFQKELDEVKPVYGVKRPVKTWNVFWINFQHFWLMTIDAWRTKSWGDKLKIWFMPTGWRPKDVQKLYPVHEVKSPEDLSKYNKENAEGTRWWPWIQLILTLAMLFHFFSQIDHFSYTALLMYGIFIMLNIFSYGTLMDGQYLSYLGEAGKIGIITWACFTLDSWYGLPVMVAVVYAAISLFMVWKILAEEDASSSDSKVLSS